MSGWKYFEKAAGAKALHGSQRNAPWHTIPAACSSLPRRQDGVASMASMVDGGVHFANALCGIVNIVENDGPTFFRLLFATTTVTLSKERSRRSSIAGRSRRVQSCAMRLSSLTQWHGWAVKRP
jgi:hypothetical protein